MIRSFRNLRPKLPQSVFVAETAMVIGDVTIGEESSVWFGAVLRGDINSIAIGRGSNIQDNTTIHVTGGTGPVEIGQGVTVGHGCIIHGCTIEDDCLIGMGAIILDNAVIGTETIIGAGSLVTQGTIIPPGSLVFGSPARVIRPLRDDEREAIRDNGLRYVSCAAEYLKEHHWPENGGSAE